MKSFGFVVTALFVGSSLIAGCSSGDDPAPAVDESSSEQDIKSSTQCKGLLPHNCQVCSDGTTACAHWTVTNKKCAIEVCAAPKITDPSQCTGLLPRNCRVCDDGKTSCAHWVVKDNACAIETCAAPPPECVIAGDCKGLLPALVKVCADGTTRGATHVCKAGTCAIEICPN